MTRAIEKLSDTLAEILTQTLEYVTAKIQGDELKL